MSYCLEYDPQRSFNRSSFLTYLALGVGASFMVPLFLNTISSTLVRDALTSPFPDSVVKLLVISGFCLVAAVSSKRFITSVTDKLLREVEETRKIAQGAEDKANDAEEKVNLVVEPEEPASPAPSSIATESEQLAFNRLPQEELSEEQKKVLSAMLNSTFATRAKSGIKEYTGIQDDTLNKALSELEEAAYLEKQSTRKGFERWTLTRRGEEIAKRLDDL